MCRWVQASPSGQGPQMGSVAVPALQVSCIALYLHSAMSTCFQLGLTSIRLTTLAAPVFMLLLLEGEFSSVSQALRSGQECGPFSLPRCLPCHSASSQQQKEPSAALSFFSLSLCLWLLSEPLALLTLILFPFRNVECLNLLLSSGADLRRRDKFGRCVDTQQ